jgi:hypothetical protein
LSGRKQLPKGALLPREVTSELLREIDAFCFKTGMTDSEFGAGATCNTSFVKSLRLDRPRLYERSIIKARRFMAEHDAK